MGTPLEFEFKATGSADVIAKLAKLAEGLKESGNEAQKAGAKAKDAGGGWKELQQSFFYVRSNVQAVAAAVQTAIAVVKKFAEEFEETVAVLNQFTGDVEEASTRTGGLVANLDLMLASNKAVQAGLNLSAHDFANAAVRAAEFADATGTDTKSALDQLTEALAKGEARGLKQFGLSLEGVTGKAEIQKEALRQLEARWGKASDTADTLAGNVQALDTSMANAKVEFFEGLNASAGLTRSLGGLSTEVSKLARALGIELSEGSMKPFKALGIGVNAMLQTMIQNLTSLTKAAREFGNQNFEAAWRELNRDTPSLQSNINEALRGAAIADARKAAVAQGEEIRRGHEATMDRLREEAEEAEKKRLARAAAARSAPVGDLPSKGPDEEKLVGIKSDLAAGIAATELGLQADINRTLAEGLKIKEDVYNLAEKQREQLVKQVNDIDKVVKLEKKRKGFIEEQAETIEKFGAVGAQAGNLIAAAIEGNAAEALKGFLMQTAKQNAVWALENTAKGIGAAIFAPHAAAGFFAAAAMHAGIAASAGIGSSAISAGNSAAPAAGSNRPVAESRNGSSQGGGTWVINVNSPLGSRAEVGRAVHLALKEAEREGAIPRQAA